MGAINGLPKRCTEEHKFLPLRSNLVISASLIAALTHELPNMLQTNPSGSLAATTQSRAVRLRVRHTISLVIALLVLAATGITEAQTTLVDDSRQQDAWRPGDATVPYSKWIFPEVPHGSLWIPPIKLWETRTTLIPTPSDSLLSAADRDAIAQAETFQNAQRLPEAIALLKLADTHTFSAEIALALANIFLSQKSGEHRDDVAGIFWLKKAAERDPQLYRVLGEFQYDGKFSLSADPAIAAHWWSVGLSRGCNQCAEELLKFEGRNSGREGIDLNFEQSLAIAMFGSDIGSRYAFRWIGRKVGWATEANRGNSAADAMAWQLRQRARGIAGTEDPRMGGVMLALQERYRTGMVQISTLKVLDSLKAGQPIAAVNTLSGLHGAGRYTGYLLDEALSLKPTAGNTPLGNSGRAWAAQEALLHGRFEQGLSVAMSYSAERSVLVLNGNQLKSEGQKANYTLARQALHLAAASGLVPDDAVLAVQTEVTYREALACWQARYISAKVGYGVLPLTTQEAERVIGGGTQCSALERIAQQLSGDANIMKHPRQHHPAVDLLHRSDAMREARVAEEAQRAADRNASYSASPSQRSSNGSVGNVSGKPMLSSAEASRRAAANVCAWSMNNSRFCK